MTGTNHALFQELKIIALVRSKYMSLLKLQVEDRDIISISYPLISLFYFLE